MISVIERRVASGRGLHTLFLQHASQPWDLAGILAWAEELGGKNSLSLGLPNPPPAILVRPVRGAGVGVGRQQSFVV